MLNKVRKFSKATYQKMSKVKKEQWKNPEYREKMLDRKKRNYTYGCREILRGRMTGKNNPNWKDGISKERDYYIKKNKEYIVNNIEKVREWRREYSRTDKCKMAARERYHKKKNNPTFHLNLTIGNAIRKAIKFNKKNRHWEELVGYTLEDLMNHLESQFDDKMSWDNQGSYWHIDHVKPKSLFKYECPEDKEFKKCWALENLQPLEAGENKRKGNHFQH